MRKRLFQTVVGFGVIAALGMLGMPAANANTPSPSVAGWFASTKPFTTATGKLTAPQVTCPPSVSRVAEVGLAWDAASSSGGAAVLVDITVSCVNGVGSMSGQIREDDSTGGEFRYFPVAEGDVISASLTYDPQTGVLRVTANNVTKQKSATTQVKLPGLTFDEAKYFLNATVTPMFTFKTIPFSHLTMNGNSALSMFTSATTYNLVINAHTLVRTSAPTSTGAGFHLISVAAS